MIGNNKEIRWSDDKENVTYSEHIDPDAIACLYEYFHNPIVSIGSIIRKMPYFLMSLVRATNETWRADISFDERTQSFVTVFSSESGSMITVTSETSRGACSVNSRNILNSVFRSDKWIKTSVLYGKVKINKDGWTYIYTKERLSLFKDHYTFQVSGKRNVLNTFKDWIFGQSGETYEVIKRYEQY
jgi:hypothetical protein